MLTEFQTNFTNPAGAVFLTPLGNISGFSQAPKGVFSPKKGSILYRGNKKVRCSTRGNHCSLKGQFHEELRKLRQA